MKAGVFVAATWSANGDLSGFNAASRQDRHRLLPHTNTFHHKENVRLRPRPWAEGRGQPGGRAAWSRWLLLTVARSKTLKAGGGQWVIARSPCFLWKRRQNLSSKAALTAADLSVSFAASLGPPHNLHRPRLRLTIGAPGEGISIHEHSMLAFQAGRGATHCRESA